MRVALPSQGTTCPATARWRGIEKLPHAALHMPVALLRHHYNHHHRRNPRRPPLPSPPLPLPAPGAASSADESTLTEWTLFHEPARLRVSQPGSPGGPAAAAAAGGGAVAGLAAAAAGDGPRLEVCISGPLVVLRASKSVLASDAALEVLAARFRDTLRVGGLLLVVIVCVIGVGGRLVGWVLEVLGATRCGWVGVGDDQVGLLVTSGVGGWRRRPGLADNTE